MLRATAIRWETGFAPTSTIAGLLLLSMWVIIDADIKVKSQMFADEIEKVVSQMFTDLTDDADDYI